VDPAVGRGRDACGVRRQGRCPTDGDDRLDEVSTSCEGLDLVDNKGRQWPGMHLDALAQGRPVDPATRMSTGPDASERAGMRTIQRPERIAPRAVVRIQSNTSYRRTPRCVLVAKPKARQGVSRPRRICADDTVMKQKLCYKREFRLRPDRIVVQTCVYALAYTAEKYGILLHEFIGLSFHDHLLFTDPNANRPAFIQAVPQPRGPSHQHAFR
jgi:hypothetical protein